MYHNVWTSDWSVAITIIGWLSFIEGLLHIVFPKAAQNTLNRAAKKNMVYFAMVLTIIITIILFSLSGLMNTTGM